MQKLTQYPRPVIVTAAVVAAWLNWSLAVMVTVCATIRPQLLGVALPTLATQALLTLGMGWGSNVARMSYFIWSIFGVLLSAFGGGIESNNSWWAVGADWLSNVLMAITLGGMLFPVANNWFLAQRSKNKGASPVERSLRAKRNLKVAAAWMLVMPVAGLIAIPLHTPFLAVVTTCAISMCVGVSILMRQGVKLYRLRAYAL